MARKRKSEKGIPVYTIIDFSKQTVNDFISQAEAARQLNLSRASISFLVSTGRLRSSVFAGRRVVLVEDVLAYTPTRPGPKKGASKKAGAKKRAKK